MDLPQRSGPLVGYRVLDLAGPPGLHCTKLLADMGADIIKVEPPSGEESRRIPPFKDDIPHPEKSLYFLHFNTNKRGITLDVETTDGRGIFLELARKADVIIETYPPERNERLGLSYAHLSAVNPRLVVASITPFGQTGPWRDYKADDIAGIALGNLLYLAGEQGKAPVQPAGELAYGMASVYAAFGVAVALYHRAASGHGQHIDVSTHECAAHIAGYYIPHYSATGAKPARARRNGEEADLYDPYAVKDGYVRFFLVSRDQWRRLVEWMGRPPSISGPEFEKTTYRRQHPAIVQAAIAEFCRGFTKQEIYEEGQKRRISVTPINTVAEFMESSQTKARRLFVEMHHPAVGKYLQFAGVPRLKECPGAISRPAPLLGEHNEEIFRGELGLSSDDLVALRSSGVI
jgi:crotonobetainyl-CoA:carnitine CoA-transferase CaiB-like acyl-CoA transferase